MSYTGGTTVRFTGTDASDRTICLTQTANGLVRRPFTILNGPMAGEYAAFQKLYAGGAAVPGTRAAYTLFANGNRWNVPSQYEITWSVIGFQPLDTTAGRFDAMVLERTEVNSEYTARGVRRFWIDTVSGVVLKGSQRVERGHFAFTPYEAVAVRRADLADATTPFSVSTRLPDAK